MEEHRNGCRSYLQLRGVFPLFYISQYNYYSNCSSAISGNLSINTSGKVGIGVWNPAYKLDVAGDINSSGCYREDSTPLAGMGTCSSDRRFKKNIHELGPLLAKIKNLRIVRFDWRSEEFPKKTLGKNPAMGVIAQEVKAIFPELIEEDQDGYLKVKLSDLRWYLAKATIELAQELERSLASYQHELESLQGKQKNLHYRTKAMQAYLCSHASTVGKLAFCP